MSSQSSPRSSRPTWQWCALMFVMLALAAAVTTTTSSFTEMYSDFMPQQVVFNGASQALIPKSLLLIVFAVQTRQSRSLLKLHHVQTLQSCGYPPQMQRFWIVQEII